VPLHQAVRVPNQVGALFFLSQFCIHHTELPGTGRLQKGPSENNNNGVGVKYALIQAALIEITSHHGLP
jgi:hypothetical protein